MVKALLFDFWGTLVEQGIYSPIKQVQDILQVRMPFSAYVARMEQAMMTSVFPDLRSAFLNVGKEFQLTPTEDQIET